MIKLKKLIKENYWNERKFGEPLPTLRLEQDRQRHFGGGENIKILIIRQNTLISVVSRKVGKVTRISKGCR